MGIFPVAVAVGLNAVHRSAVHEMATVAVANDNRTPAGRVVGDTLELHLTVSTVEWRLLGDSSPPLVVAAFGEEGKTPTIPGPLLRVKTGTPIHVVVRNPMDDTLIVRGFSERGPGIDSLVLPPGASSEARFARHTPGTFQYWATLAKAQRALPFPRALLRHGLVRFRFDSQLIGAFVVDPAGPVPDDRVFVITEMVDQAPPFRAGDRRGVPGRELTAINGASWPATERLHYAVGDTVRWRIINATLQPHPMHLHGFYFRVDSHTDAETGTCSGCTPADRHMAVTELIAGGDGIGMAWSPDRPGGWLFHCHLTPHVAMFPRLDNPNDGEYPDVHEHGDPDHHALTGMNGLVLGITVSGSTAARTAWRPAKRMRLFVQSDSVAADSARRFGYVLQRGAEPRRDSVERPGPVLVLTRGEATSIEVINHTPEPTSVHWHGIELESYYDGVAGWSREGTATAPAIRPESTFEVHIIAKRAGTFMYHTHFDDMRQQFGGLVGPLVVLEPGEQWDARRELVFMISDGAPGRLVINGSASPPAKQLQTGTTYRIRVADLAIYSLGLVVRVVRDTSVVTWRPVAKDGFALSPSAATQRTSVGRVSSGETADFELTPSEPGKLSFEIGRVSQPTGVFQRQSVVSLRVVDRP